MKKNLFLVYNEYHLMYAISIIVQKYLSNDYENTVLLSNNRGQRRLPSEIGKNKLFANFILLKGDESTDEVSYDDVEVIKSLSTRSFDNFTSFLDNTPYFYYLHYFLFKRGTNIILGADGAKPYKSVQGFTYASQFKKTIQLYHALFRRKLLVPFWLLTSDKVYAKSARINELWVPFTNDLKTKRDYEIETIELVPNAKVLNHIFDVFQVSDETRNLTFKNSILYINSTFPNENGYGLELDVVKKMQNENPNSTLYIKCHPQTPLFQKEAYQEIEGVQLLEIKLPAELIISLFTDSVIVSFWSTSLLTNNKDCRFYWLINFCEKYLGYKIIDLPIFPEHITRLNNKSELCFNL